MITEGDWIGATEICQLCRIEFRRGAGARRARRLAPRQPAAGWQVPATACRGCASSARLMRDLGAQRQWRGAGAGAAGGAARTRAPHPRARAPGQAITDRKSSPLLLEPFDPPRGVLGRLSTSLRCGKRPNCSMMARWFSAERSEPAKNGVQLGRGPPPGAAGRPPPIHPAPRGSRRAAAACRRRSAPPHPARHPRPTACPRA